MSKPPDNFSSLSSLLFPYLKTTRFFQLTVAGGSKPIPDAAFHRINGILDAASVDWIKYAPYNWFIYAESPERIYSLIRKIPEVSDAVIFLVKIDPTDKSGQLPDAAWKWFAKSR